MALMEKHRELMVSYRERPAQVESYTKMNEHLASCMELAEQTQ